MINKKRKGFTIVELVIVIAVVAVLASVLIPTFSSLIERANQSADLQAVRQMNTALATESVMAKPTEIKDVIKILEAAGFNAMDKLVPVSANHGFYWCEAANTVVLVKDEPVENPILIFPIDNETLNTAFNEVKNQWSTAEGFFDLETAGIDAGLPPTLEGDGNGGNGGAGGNGNGGEQPGDETTADETTADETTADETTGVEKPEGTALTADNIDEMLAKLQDGGTFYLEESVTISKAITISAETIINLNGNTLTLEDPSTKDGTANVLTVSGILTIKDGSDGEPSTIVIKTTDNSSAWNFNCGICVNDGGELNIDNVNIDGNRLWNIENYGDIYLTNSTFTVKAGYGLANAGAAYVNYGEFVANGSDITPIYGAKSGTMSITGTTFSENTGTTIDWDSTGALTLTDVTMETSASNVDASSAKVTINGGDFEGALSGTPLVIIADEDDVFAADITLTGTGNSISGGTFNGKLTIQNSDETTITGGTFTGGLYCEVASVTIDGGTFSSLLHFYHKSIVTINGGTFNSQLKCAEGGEKRFTITINNEYTPVFSNGTSEKVSYSQLDANANPNIFAGAGGESAYSKTEDFSLTKDEINNCWVIRVAS